jgi:cysteine desulfurase
MTDRPIYLDHNAATPVLPEVVDAMLPFLREHFGNPSSAHIYGRVAHEAVEQARSEVAALLACARMKSLLQAAPRPTT